MIKEIENAIKNRDIDNLFILLSMINTNNTDVDYKEVYSLIDDFYK